MFACRGSKARCEIQIPDDLWCVEADPGQLGQVFQNLVINAVQAMPTGGTIDIHAENLRLKEISDVPLSPGKYVKISIRDQGIGIPAEYILKIFDPYFTTKQAGSGLGLATAFSIIKNHNGHISAESTMGGGTTLRIFLPASDQQIGPQPGPERKALPGKGKILVMDDEEIVRDVLGKMLANLGYEAKFAQDGAEAVEKFIAAQKTGDKFEAVILDLTVPGGIGGKDTIRKLLDIDPQVKAIVSSGYSDDPIMANFKAYGFSGMIAKPYKVLDLSDVLHDVIIKTM
jgi:CheY-like chemotaxis protein